MTTFTLGEEPIPAGCFKTAMQILWDEKRMPTGTDECPDMVPIFATDTASGEVRLVGFVDRDTWPQIKSA